MIFRNDPPVITGIGIASPLGNTKTALLHNLEQGKSGLEYIEGFDITTLPVKKAFQVKDSLSFSSEIYDPYVNFALHAAQEAIKDASLTKKMLSKEKLFTVVSSSKGGMISFEKIRQNESTLRDHFQSLFTDQASLMIMKELKLTGSISNIVAACASGVHSIIAAARAIGTQHATCALAGASDASITPLMLAGYKRLHAYSYDNMRPFDVRRSGFMIGEGAGVIIVEPESRAHARGAEIYARIRGYLMAQDIGAPTHFDPHAHVLSDAIQRLLKMSDITSRDIDYVSLHGTSTVLGDKYEALECMRAFGKDIKHIKFNALKSMLGHMLGASGAVETIITALSIRNNIIFPTINVTRQAPFAQFDLNCYKRSPRVIERALKISMGFGGHIGLLLLER